MRPAWTSTYYAQGMPPDGAVFFGLMILMAAVAQAQLRAGASGCRGCRASGVPAAPVGRVVSGEVFAAVGAGARGLSVLTGRAAGTVESGRGVAVS
jgi:hypothetical protein